MQQPARREYGGVRIGVPLVAVGVDKTRHEIRAVRVDDRGRVALCIGDVAHRGDPLALYRHSVGMDGSRVHVHDLAVSDDRIGGLVAHGHVDEGLTFQLVHHYFTRPPFRHRLLD